MKNECCPFCLSLLPGGGLTDTEMAARLYSLSIEYAMKAMGCDRNGMGMSVRMGELDRVRSAVELTYKGDDSMRPVGSFQDTLAKATAALDVIGTGKLRDGELVTEGCRSYVKQKPARPAEPEGK